MENRYGGARREAEKHSDFIDLIDTNFHSCGFRYPQTVIHAATNRYFAGADARQYRPDPAGDPALRAAIAAYYRDAGSSVPHDSSVPADSLVVTASASESYSHIFAARCSADDRVLLPRPGYPLFEDIAIRNGLAVDFYDQRRSADWSIDPDELGAILRPRTAAIVLISPNNPTGSVISESTIRRIGAICENRGLFLVVDEVFSEILFAGSSLPRPAPLLPDVPVYTINGVSKLFASPELKVSWIAVSGPADTRGQAVEDLLVQNDLFLSASSMSQFIAAEMFAGGMEFPRAMAAEIARRRELMLGEIARIDGLSAVPPAGGIHVPVEIDPEILPAGADDEEIAVELLLDHRVAAHPGYLYGMDQPVSLVMSYLAPEDRILEGMSRIERYLKVRSR
ncbi:MAG: pyridoxal phosphate-dependent aminotransferase [Spirochaetales bacterium]|nr:pyridoxal phosphate-dependent aminotransferase [Spirochaetales bacterium]